MPASTRARICVSLEHGGTQGADDLGAAHPPSLGLRGARGRCGSAWWDRDYAEATRSTSSPQNALRSSGLRLLTSTFGPLSQTTTSSSTQSAPALRRSVLQARPGRHPRPRTTSASTKVHGAWQIDATGLPASKKDFAKVTAAGWVRRKSGLATPPGSTRAS